MKNKKSQKKQLKLGFKRKEIIMTLGALLLAILNMPPRVYAQTQGDAVIEICNSAGVCTPVDPYTSAAILLMKMLTDELNKEHPFGQNNEIVKAIEEIKKFANNGLGENNDIRKFLVLTGIDDLLRRLGIKL